MKRKRVKKTVIITGYRCSNNCTFCTFGDKHDLPDRTTAEITAEMIAARKRGTTYLEFIGGECTIRSDIVQLIRYAKEIGFSHIVMATNGRMFAYKEFAKNIIDAGLTELIFSLHGHTAKLHDTLTRSPGSFQQLLQGVKHVRQLGLKRIGTNTTIVKQNYNYIKEIGQMIFNLGIKNAEFIFVDPTHGLARKNFRRVIPKISTIAPFVRDCLSIAKGLNDYHWAIRYVPLCHFVGFEDQISELNEAKLFDSEHIAADFVNRNVTQARQSISRIKPRRCKTCRYFSMCEGIWKTYVTYYGDKELQPIH